jgi:flagellar hook-associated protein 3 FlgL
MDSVGDLARSLVLRTNQVRLRTEMDKLAVEVATGLAEDPAKKLGGDVSSLNSIDRTLARLEAFRISTSEAKLITGTMQGALDIAQERGSDLASTLLGAELTPNIAMTTNLSGNAEATLSQVLSNLNQSVAGRFLFSGTATDTPPLVNAETLVGMARDEAVLAGVTSLADLDALLDDFFSSAPSTTTSFQGDAYQGSGNSLAPLQIGEGDTADIDIRADDQELRDFLQPMVMAALAADPALNFDVNTQVDILREAGVMAIAAQEGMTNIRAGLGATEARVEDAIVRNAAERTASSMAKLDLIGSDPYETATRYEDVRMQLESLYAITARSQRLTLTQFL